ncbi:MAG TPA: hypothetical protein G4O06_08050, partial [Dehalococcoidia bacterium]|nr:hypothetical protein [Dehalococcoidia bacterium]
LAADTGINIRVVPEVNPMLRFKWVKTGLFHSVAESPSMVADLMEAKAGNAVRDGGPFQIRLMYSYSMSNSGFVVRGDSDIYEPSDIKPGVKFVDFAFFPGFIEGFPSALMAWAGVDIDDVEWVPVGSYGAAMRAISDGKADISMAFNTSPATVEAAAAPHGIRFINLPADEDPEGARRFLEFYPVISFGEATQGPPEAIAGVTTTLANTGIYVRADADPDLIYHLAKWLDENYDSFKDNHAWNQYMTIDTLMDLTETCFIPVHDGLKKYLNEKGLWTAAHEARQQQNIDLITQYVEAYQAAKDEADDTGIAVDPTTEEWLELWASYKADIPRFSMFLGLEE